MTNGNSPLSPESAPMTSARIRPQWKRSRENSGKFLVIGLLLLGIAATTLLFVYWDLHTKPFRPLREAIGREFRHSRPNVEGGRHKGRGPWTLRISMTVDFPPAEETAQSRRVFERVLEIARQYNDMNEIEKIEVNLIQFVPQELAKTKTLTWPEPPAQPQ